MTKEEREQIRAKVVVLMEDDTSKELLRQYTKALSRSKKIIERMYARYSVKGTLTYGEMTKYNRIQSVWDSITSELTDLTGVKEKSIKKLARDAYEYEYFHEAYEMDGIRKEYSLRSDWMMLNRDQVEASIQNPLSGLTLNDRLKVHREEIIRNAKGTITQGLIFGEDYFTIARKMKDLFEGDATKALRVARTECHRVQNEGKHAIELRAKEAGVKMDKEWVHSGDDLVRDEHKALGGQIADSEGYFHFQGFKALYPGGFGVAKLDINCRCRYRMFLLKKNGERFRDNELVTGETFEQWAERTNQVPYTTQKTWIEKEAKVQGKTVRPITTTKTAIPGEITDDEIYHSTFYTLPKDVQEEVQGTLKKYHQDLNTNKILDRGIDLAEKKAYASASYGIVDGKQWKNIGLHLNRKYFGDRNAFEESLKRCVSTGFHPSGCNTIKSVVDHEMGHILHFKLNASEAKTEFNNEITALKKKINKGVQLKGKYIKDPSTKEMIFKPPEPSKIAKGLSSYATKSSFEFIAEGWAEYINNPNPREIAKQVGEIMIKYLKKVGLMK